MKTLRIDKTRRYYTNHTTNRTRRRAIDTKMNDVRRDYWRRCEKLDRESNDIGTNLFTSAMKNDFHSGGVHPLVFGAYGETNEGTRDLIKTCAKR